MSALENQRKDPRAAADVTLHKLSESSLAQSNLNLTLQKISSVTGEVASTARSLGQCFDDTRNVAGLNFGEFVSEIDSKINSMPVHTVLRRVRDVMKVAEMRIGVLTARCEELYDVNNMYETKLNNLVTSTNTAKRTLMNVDFVGPNPSPHEIDDFTSAPTGEYGRFGLKYEDLDDQWIEQNLFHDAVLKTPGLVRDEEEDSDADSDIMEAQVKAMTVQANRRAHVVPRSPTHKLADHSDLN